MKLKGELDSIGLSELFKTLTEQRVNGVLTIATSIAQKTIVIAEGEICVISDRLTERTRLGDLLIARGRITEQQLQECLKLQRTVDQRSRLGDILIKTGAIKPQDIGESLRFQMEEELYDLFTWKGATFDFDGERSVEETINAAGFDDAVQRVTLNPQALITEATRRAEEWKALEARLPSPYLCFKLTPKGEELSSKGTQATQIILRLLKEGRTIETTVKRSCLGRFNVCKALVKLLDDGWIYPYPATELRMLAAEHRAANRYSDALYIYRRILEGLPTDSEKAELEKQIDETLEAIRRAQESGEAVEGAETISYKEAADRFKRRERRKRMAMLGVLGAALIGGTYYLSTTMGPRSTADAEEYREVMQKADQFVAQKKYREAVATWETFLNKIPNKQSPTARVIQERLEELPLRHTEYLETLLQPLEKLEEAGKDEQAETGLKRLLELYGESPLAERMQAALNRIADKREKKKRSLELQKLQATLSDARQKLQIRQYNAVRPVFQRVLDLAPEGTPEHAEADAALKTIKDIEDRSRACFEAAQKQVAEGKAEEALANYERAAEEWPELPTAEAAKREIASLNARYEQLKQDLTRANLAAGAGGVVEAIELYKQIRVNYAEFILARSADDKIAQLSGQVGQFDKELEHARARYKASREEGRALFRDLLRKHSAIVLQRQVTVPLAIASFPSGAAVVLDGKEIGTTPLEADVLAGRPVVLEFKLDGYAPQTERIQRIGADNMEVTVPLSRQPVAIVDLKPGLFTAPRVFSGKLVALHGTTLSLLEPAGLRTLTAIDNLFDDRATTRPNSSGSGPAEFVSDKSWWWPRTPPVALGDSRLLLALRTRDILELDLNTTAYTKRFSMPVEPVGRVHLEQLSVLRGKPLLAVGGADGKVRVFDFEKPGAPLWEKPIDPAASAARGAPVDGGLSSLEKGSFLALSTSGRLAQFNVIDGTELRALDLKGALLPQNALPAAAGETLAPLVFADGKLALVDLQRFEILWERPGKRGLQDTALAVCEPQGLLVIARDGALQRLPKERSTAQPAALWTFPLGEAPACLPAWGKYIYAASSNGTLYAIHPDNGRLLWNMKVEGRPIELLEQDGLLYVALQEGRLLILRRD